MTDVNGVVVWSASYTPFGVATVNEDPDGDTVLVTNNFRLPGQYYDTETGLNYNYFRTYDPLVGRYTQSDPIGLRGGLNPFGYVLNDPMNSVDVLGLIWVTVDRKLDPRSIPLYILNLIAQKIGSGFAFTIPGSARDEYLGLRRKVIQEWQCNPNDPPETASLKNPKPGDRREIQQTYVITIRGPLKDNLIKKPDSPFFYHWVPFVPDRTYDNF